MLLACAEFATADECATMTIILLYQSYVTVQLYIKIHVYRQTRVRRGIWGVYVATSVCDATVRK